MEEDIYKDAKSAVEATEKAKRYNDDRTALEILNDLLLKSRMLGADNVRINDEFKEEVRRKLIEDINDKSESGIERLNRIIRKQVIFGDIEKDVDDDNKTDIRNKLIEEINEEIRKRFIDERG